MKIMKVGVLTSERREFYEFEQSNPNFNCYHICKEYDLLGVTVDFFIRLWGWEKLNPHVLEVVLIQEKIRGLSRKEEKPKLRGNHTNWELMTKGELVSPYQSNPITHPMNRCVTQATNIEENLKASAERLCAPLKVDVALSDINCSWAESKEM